MSTTAKSAGPLIDDPGYAALKAYIIGSTGLCYYETRDEVLSEHVADRLAALEAVDCSAYLRLLKSETRGEEELDRLIERLTIGETHFFRHREVFHALRERVLPDILHRNAESRRIRVWSAGCSIGAEPYSISILLRRDLAHLTRGWDISILGTDVNRQFLARATRGHYEAWTLRGLPDDVRDECFRAENEGWVLQGAYRQGVSFQYHNLVKHPFPSLVHNLFAFDLILCRNVLIYFGRDLMKFVIDKARESLVEGGWLVVGHAEYDPVAFNDLAFVSCSGAVVYHKRGAGKAAAAALASAPPGGVLPPLTPSADCGPRQARTSKRSGHPKTSEAGVPRRAVEKLCPGPAKDDWSAIRRLADTGRLEQAIVACNALVRADRLDPVRHFYLALLIDQLGDHEGAEQSLRRSIYLAPNYVLAYYYLGQVQQKRGKHQDAARTFQRVLRLTATLDRGHSLEGSDGLSVADLDELTRMHLGIIDPP
jgi:chemotaxis protein methyltransferase CheR